MTGRELILYILENNLENEPVFQNGEFIGFVSLDKAANILDVGRETVKTWIALGLIENFIVLGNAMIVPITEIDRMKEVRNNNEK